jgi:hypothetical protein
VTVALSGCSTGGDPRIWQVAPLEFDNALDHGASGVGAELTDVTYSMNHITGDTLGGFWTESAGSWLHIDAEGQTASRFNSDISVRVEGLAALTPTLLAVAHGSYTGFEQATRSTVSTFDTATKNWVELPLQASSVGDLAIAPGNPANPRIVFVDFFGAPVVAGQGRSFGLSISDLHGHQSALVGPEADLHGDDVDIAVAPGGDVLVSTDTQSFRVAADGFLSHRSVHAAGTPIIAVSPAGLVLGQTDAPASARTAEGRIRGGSRAAHSILDGTDEEPPGLSAPLVLAVEGAAVAVPFTDGAAAAVWLDDGRFVFVAPGAGDASVLAVVTLPARR